MTWRCPKCLRKHPDDRTTCDRCGRSKPTENGP